MKLLGSVEELLKEVNSTQILTSQLSPEAVDEIKAVLEKHNATIQSIDHPTSSLEDLFHRTVERSVERPGERYVPPGDASKTEDASKN